MSYNVGPDKLIEIAKPLAHNLLRSGTLDEFFSSPQEEIALTLLSEIADSAGMHNTTYTIEATKAYLIPAISRGDVTVTHFTDGVGTTAKFSEFSTVRMRNQGGMGVRALCATFTEGIITPGFEVIPSDHLLHIPVLNVSSLRIV